MLPHPTLCRLLHITGRNMLCQLDPGTIRTYSVVKLDVQPRGKVQLDRSPRSALVANTLAGETDGKKGHSRGKIIDNALQLSDQLLSLILRFLSPRHLLDKLTLPPPRIHDRGEDKKNANGQKLVETPGIVLVEPRDQGIGAMHTCRNYEDNNRGKKKDNPIPGGTGLTQEQTSQSNHHTLPSTKCPHPRDDPPKSRKSDVGSRKKAWWV